jgi:hypothetical protein
VFQIKANRLGFVGLVLGSGVSILGRDGTFSPS